MIPSWVLSGPEQLMWWLLKFTDGVMEEGEVCFSPTPQWQWAGQASPAVPGAQTHSDWSPMTSTTGIADPPGESLSGKLNHIHHRMIAGNYCLSLLITIHSQLYVFHLKV